MKPLSPGWSDPSPNETVRVLGKTVKKSEWLEHLRSPKKGQHIYRNGFLSLSGLVEAAYECSCGFRGIFESNICHKCGKTL